MTALRVIPSSGRAPRVSRRLLGDAQAQVATNCRLTDGRLAPLRSPLSVNDPEREDPISIFRMVMAGVEKWLSWSTDVDVARGPIAGDTLQRIYWTGDGEPRMSTFAVASASSAPYPTGKYVLGVSPPTVAPGVSPAGGASATTETRSYVYTFKTALGEESAPSPASDAEDGKEDDTWSLSAMQAAPANSYTISAAAWSAGFLTLTVDATFGLRAGERLTVVGLAPAVLNASWDVAEVPSSTTLTIAMDDPGAISDQNGTATRDAPHNTTGMKKLIYRTITAASGATEYRFVVELPVADATYDDTIANSVVAKNERLLSQDPDVAGSAWEMPPVDAKGLIALPNGIMACFSKNTLCLSEPFQPHAWPSRYRQTCNYTIVAIGWFGTTIVVGTEGVPYTLTGVEPATMGGGWGGLNVAWPCLSKRGLVSAPFGVMYPAPQGLAVIGMVSSEIVTREFFTDEEWSALAPSTFIAAMSDNRYYASYESPLGRLVLVIDKGENAPITDATVAVNEFWTDPSSGKLYLTQGDLIYQWDGYVNMQYDWMSKEFVMPQPINMGAAKVDADFTMTDEEEAAIAALRALILAANQAMIDAGYIGAGMASLPTGYLPTIGTLLAALPEPVGLQFQLYVNNVLKFTKTLSSARAFKLPSTYRSDAFAVRVTGEPKVHAILLGKAMDDLRAI